MCKCRFIPQKEFPSLSSPTKKTKPGRYHQSMFWDLPGWGDSAWIVAVKIVIEEDFGHRIKNKEKLKSLVEECIAFLNKKPRKNSKFPYGNLQFYSAEVKENEIDGKYIIALLSTDEKKNKNFWNSGPVVLHSYIKTHKMKQSKEDVAEEEENEESS